MDVETGDGFDFDSGSPLYALYAGSIPQAYKGNHNCDTGKGVNFFGPNCEYVVSGSEGGPIFIWRKVGVLLLVMEGDKYVGNCIEHCPHATSGASSGIEP